MKKVIFSAALLMGVAIISFAGNPKDGKTNVGNATETKAGQQLYWYKVSYATDPNGIVPANSPLVAHDEEANVNSPCDAGSERDCLRGFQQAQTAETDAPGDAQIKTDEE
jgi:hypothetical protein